MTWVAINCRCINFKSWKRMLISRLLKMKCWLTFSKVKVFLTKKECLSMFILKPLRSSLWQVFSFRYRFRLKYTNRRTLTLSLSCWWNESKLNLKAWPKPVLEKSCIPAKEIGGWRVFWQFGCKQLISLHFSRVTSPVIYCIHKITKHYPQWIHNSYVSTM